MTKRVYRHTRRKRSSSFLRSLFSSVTVLALGAGFFWQGMLWLRSHDGVTGVVADASDVAETLAPESVSAATPLLPRANLVSAFDHQVTGVVNRVPGQKSAEYHVIAYLPGLQSTEETYAVWLLKDGLADVKHMGDLSPRADGSWVSDFTADALSGIPDPDLYRTLVILKEKRQGEESTKGEKMAEAEF